MGTPTWDEMHPRERDAWIAEHVMGYVWFRYHSRGKNRGVLMTEFGKNQCEQLTQSPPTSEVDDWRDTSIAPSYTTDAAADYLVLARFRDSCDTSQACEFVNEVGNIWHARYKAKIDVPRGCIQYEPGDYSHAAFITCSL